MACYDGAIPVLEKGAVMHDLTHSTPALGSRRSCSFLLRLWQEEPGSPWRAMLRCVGTQEEHLFHNLQGLLAFLETRAGETAPSNKG
jgi:hypothetical protein